MELKGTSVGVSFLKVATKTDYHEMRLKVIEKFGLTKYNIPIYHYMTMYQPKFDTRILEIDLEYVLINRESKLKKKRKDISETRKNKITKLFYCKLILRLYDILVLLLEKCERKFCNNKFWQQKIERPGIDDKVIVLISADGAAHQISKEGDSNIISLNLLIINSLLLKEGLISTQSHSIIITMQVTGAEKPEICCTMFVSFLQKIKLFDNQNLPVQYQHLDFVFFHLNDAKIFYSLMQHLLFN